MRDFNPDEHPGDREPPAPLPPAERRPLSRLLIKQEDRAFFVSAGSIRWIEADDDLVWLHCLDRSYRVRSTLSGLHKRLDPQRFLRVHRSAIVNIDVIREIRILANGEHQIVLDKGDVLKLSRTFRHSLEGTGAYFGGAGPR